MNMMQLGLGSYAYAWAIGVIGYPPKHPMSVFDFLRKAHQFQYECIQIADNLPLHLLTGDEIMALHEKAQAWGIRIEVGMRGLIKPMVKRYLDIAGQLDADILRLVIDTSDFEPTLPEICRSIVDLLPIFKDKGIRLAIENHDRFRATDFLQIIEETDANWVGICLDSVNSLGKGEGFYEVAEKLLPYTINLHVKDYTIKRVDHQMGFLVSGAIAGQGMLPIPWLLKETEKHGKCQSAILELWPTPEADVTKTIEKESWWVRESTSYLQDLWATK